MSKRYDLQTVADNRNFYMAGYGHLMYVTTAVPVNGIQGFAPGAFAINVKGTAGSLFYVNQGTFASATWFNIA